MPMRNSNNFPKIDFIFLNFCIPQEEKKEKEEGIGACNLATLECKEF
jgi:hypothetical protein